MQDVVSVYLQDFVYYEQLTHNKTHKVKVLYVSGKEKKPISVFARTALMEKDLMGASKWVQYRY